MTYNAITGKKPVERRLCLSGFLCGWVNERGATQRVPQIARAVQYVKHGIIIFLLTAKHTICEGLSSEAVQLL